jgi:LPXTG-motif cell wall-anchored protein
VTPPASTTTGSSTLPTTGANFVGLLALAGSFTVAGGTSVLARRRLAQGVLAVARRATRGFAAAR